MSGVQRVNLLPEAIQWRNAGRARRRGWGMALCATLMISALAWQWSSRHAGEVRRADAGLEQARADVDRQKKLAAALAARLTDIEARFAVLDAMRGTRAWSPRLSIIAKAVPPDMLLTRFNAATQALAAKSDGRSAAGARSPAPPDSTAMTDEVRIDGYALDHTDIATFLRRLKDSGLFSRVDLVRSIREDKDTRVVLNFGITCSR